MGYVLGRQRALVIAGLGRRRMHSLPEHHGALVALCAGIPAFGVLIVGSWMSGGSSLPIAGLADFMDGRVARKTRRSSMLGGDLDSLSDLISFGLAPACLGFALGLNGGWDSAVLVYFVCCGLGRLARYNATASSMADDSGKVRYYQGAPIPTSLVLVAVLAGLLGAGLVDDHLPLGELALGPWTFHPLVLVFLAHGSAMISGRLRVPKP